MYNLNLIRPAWAEIDLDNLANNMREVRRLTKDSAKVTAVIKGDGYGHGARYIAETLLENGADRFAVAVLEEALELRGHGITAPILVLGYTQQERSKEIVTNDIEQTVYSYESAKELSMEAEKQNKKVKIHVKIDTGLGRIGFKVNEETIACIREIYKLPNLIIEGVFTHFATAHEKDKTYTWEQFNKFKWVTDRLKNEGINFGIRHCGNSSAIIDLPEMDLDMVRAGSILYGLAPSNDLMFYRMDMKQVMSLKARITYIKEIEPGESVSYGRNFIASEKTKIASLPLGFGDGYSRSLSGKAEVLVNGVRVPVVGLICMDQCMIDVTGIEDVKIGDEVVLLGKQKDSFISVSELAEKIGTSTPEVTTIIGKRIPRVYVKEGEITDVVYSIPLLHAS